jgi:hypothetical protein
MAAERRPAGSLTASESDRLNAWRSAVVRRWLVAMAGALGLWAAATGFDLPSTVEHLLALVLALAVLVALRATRSGRCPRCGMRIHFEPRIELPSACSHCGVAFEPETADTGGGH